MKEPFIPKSTISEMLPHTMRGEFFRRVLFPNGKKMRVPDRGRALEMTKVRNRTVPEYWERRKPIGIGDRERI